MLICTKDTFWILGFNALGNKSCALPCHLWKWQILFHNAHVSKKSVIVFNTYYIVLSKETLKWALPSNLRCSRLRKNWNCVIHKSSRQSCCVYLSFYKIFVVWLSGTSRVDTQCRLWNSHNIWEPVCWGHQGTVVRCRHTGVLWPA